MEKRISYTQFQSVRSVAKAIDPIVKKLKPIEDKIQALEEERKNYQAMIAALEKGIVEVTGFHVTDLVKKVVEVTGTNAEGKPIKSTKFLPTDIVRYDEAKKQYVVAIEEEEVTTENEEPIEVPTTEGVFGNDFDYDAQRVEEEKQIDPLSNDIFQ